MERETNKKLKFLMFENATNLCWLDASISLVAHNRTIKKIVESSPESQINKIISAYNEAVAVFNSSNYEQKIPKTKKLLLAIQNSSLKYLKQFLKFKPGEPDSAFCALLNLIYRDKSNIKEYLNVSWIWRKVCSNCGVNSKSVTCLKPIITLSKVDAFCPECPSSIYMCTCKSEQEMKLIYKELPACLIFHFENGVGTGTHFPYDFSIKGREYQLTSLVILEKRSDLNMNHFITWIRNPSSDMWLECNDLNNDFAAFSSIKPDFNLNDVYMAVFEAFDNLDKIHNDDISIDQDLDVENSNVELIDLSDEENGAKNTDSYSKTKDSESSKESQNETVTNISERNSGISASSKKLSSGDKEKSSITAQNLEICGSEQSKKSEIFSSVIKQSISVPIVEDNRKFPMNTSKNFDSQNNAVSELTGTEETNYPEHKGTKTIVEHLKISSSENLEKNGNDKSKIKSNNLNYQDKNVDDALENKNFEAETSDNPKHKITVVSVKNKNDSNSFDSNIVTENVTADHISQNETLSAEKSTHNSPVSHTKFENTSDIKESQNEKSEDNKSLKKLEQTLLKKNENKHDSSDEEEFMNDQAASTSLMSSDEIRENILKLKMAAIDENSSRKKIKMSDSKKGKAPEKSTVEIPKASDNAIHARANISKEDKEKIKKMVDFHVNRSLATFFGEIFQLHGKK